MQIRHWIIRAGVIAVVALIATASHHDRLKRAPSSGVPESPPA